MATAFKKGDLVRQIVKPIEGTVVRPEIVDDQVQFVVQWEDADGIHQRHFTEEQLEGVPHV